MSFLEEALAYVRAGFAVFPCGRIDDWDDPKDVGKKPQPGYGLNHAVSTEDDAIAAWTRYPDMPIGLVVPDGLFVVDFDNDDALAAFPPLPPTVTTKSPRGFHLWYRGDVSSNHNPLRASSNPVLPEGVYKDVDIKAGAKGYVLAPPSVTPRVTHITGGEYSIWSGDIRTDTPAEAPEWLVLACYKPEREFTPVDPGDLELCFPLQQRKQDAREWLAKHPGAKSKYEGGEGRNQVIYDTSAMVYNDFGLTEDTALEVLLEWNAEKVVPPYPEPDLYKALLNAQQYAKDAWGCHYAMRVWGKKLRGTVRAQQFLDEHDGDSLPAAIAELPKPQADKVLAAAARKATKSQAQALKKQVELARSEKALEQYSIDHGFVPNLEHGDNAILAREFHRYFEHTTGHPLAYDSHAFWEYRDHDGMWKPVHPSKASNVIQSWSQAGLRLEDGKRLRVADPDAVLKLAKTHPHAGGRGEGYFRHSGGLAFRNGFLKPDAADLVSHSPDNRVTFGLPYDYDPLAKCPRFQQFLTEVWPATPDFKDRARLLQEFIGGALFGVSTMFGKALILKGSTGTGKSTLVEIISKMFPDDGISHVRPHDMGNPIISWSLLNSRLNVSTEMPSATLKDIDVVKTVISGEATQTNPKYKDAVSIYPKAAHIFAANTLPQISKLDNSFWARFLMLTFEGPCFRDSGQEVIGLAGKIASAEGQGVAAWAVEGGRRLLRNGAYTVPDCSVDGINEWRSDANPVASFVKNCCRLTTAEDGTGASEIYTKYKIWALKGTYKPGGPRYFKEQMINYGVAFKKTDKGNLYGVVYDEAKAKQGE